MRKIYRGWLKIAHLMGQVMTTLLMTVVYLLIVPFFLFIKLKDPLRIKQSAVESYWEPWLPEKEILEDFYRLS